MKILLANSPWSKPGYYGVRAGSRWPHFEEECANVIPFPFFLAYATAMLEREGVDATVIDALTEGNTEDEFMSRISSGGYDFILYEISTASMETDLRIGRNTRSLLGKDCFIAFAGPDINVYQPGFLEAQPWLDFVLIGEYEETLVELVQALQSGNRDFEAIKGLIYRDKTGAARSTGRRPLIQDLDKLPWPARNQLPMKKYNDRPGGIPYPSLQMWASRGCPFQCTFCAWPQIVYDGPNYRVRDPVDVVDEIEDCVKKYGIKSVYFDDDTFNLGKKRLMTLCQELIDRRLNLPWAVMARADTMDREILEKLREAGLWSLKYGIESSDQRLVDACEKKLDLKKSIEMIKLTRSLGIDYHLTFTFGLPGETWETARRTIDFCMEMDPCSVQFSIVTPFPGSKLYDEMKAKGYLMSDDWSKFDGYTTAVIRTDTLTPTDLEEILREANRKWRIHLLTRILRNPRKLLKKSISEPRKAVKRLGEIVQALYDQI